MQRDIGVDVIVRLADRITQPMRDVEDRVSRAARRMADGLKLSATLNTNQITAAANRLSASGARAQQYGRDQLQMSRDHLDASRKRTMSLYGEAAAVAAQGWAYGQMLRPAIEFEAKMAEVGKVVDFEGATGLTDLGNDIQALVTSGALPMAAGGIADIVAAAAQASLIDEALPDAEKRRQLVEFAEAAAKMGIAFDISAGQAGQAMAVWRAQLGLTQDETLLLGDAVNHLSNKMNASAADITDIIGRQGGFAKVAGLNNAEIAALATAFRTAAPSSEVAATAMKNFTATLVAGEAMTDRQSQIMQRLGFDAVELAQRMRVDARGSIIDVMEALQRLPEHEQAASLRQLFGDEAVGAVAPLLGNLDNLRKAFDLVGDQASYAGAMQAEYEGVAGTTAAKLVVFQNHLTRLAVSLTPLLSVITEVTAAMQPMLQAMGDWMQANPEIVKWIGIGVASLFGLKVAVLGVQMVVQSLVGGFWLFNGALAAGIWVYGAAVRGIAALVRVFGVLRMALPMVVRGIALMSRALLANPIGIAVAAIAGAAYLIWRNWEPVKAWFQRLWSGIRTIFGGFGRFVSGIFSGDMAGAVAGLKQAWGGLKGYYRTLWDSIAGIFRAVWENAIRPITDALGITDGIVAGWNIAKEAVSAALDALSAKFAAVWAVISPVISGLKWVNEQGGAALNSVTGGTKGPISSGYNAAADAGNDVIAPPIPQYANGGSFSPGLIMVGERGPELRYENRGGFIAHNNALRGLVDLSARAAALAGVVMGAGAGPTMANPAPPAIAAPTPQYANGGGFTPGLIMVGERGPELRYESRGGFIAHNNALRGLVDLSARAAALAGVVMGAGPDVAMADQTGRAIAAENPVLSPAQGGALTPVLNDLSARAAAPAGGARQISYEPHYNIVVNGSGLDAAQLRAAIRAEMDAADRRAQADLRRLLHD